MEPQAAGKIILMNGPSSAGKSTLCRAVQAQIPEPFLQFSLDFLMFQTEVLPKRRETQGPFSWAQLRPKLFLGYYGCLAALAKAGNNLVVDYIIETEQQLRDVLEALEFCDVFLVGVHCPLPELERRERLRQDRRSGDARRDLETVHSFTAYDLEVDSTLPAEQNAATIIAAWQTRQEPGVFRTLLATRTA